MKPVAAVLFAAATLSYPQSKVMNQGSHRMEITIERLDANGSWRTVDPALVLAHGDRVRFRFRTNFNGYLYVTNQASSGAYEQLFPSTQAGHDNRIQANKEYQVPPGDNVFRISGPAGYEVVYWLVSPVRLTESEPGFKPLPPEYRSTAPLNLIPRCDDTVLRARGACLDSSAGPKLIPKGDNMTPRELLDQSSGQGSGDLMVMRQQNKSVISSAEPLSGPVIYEFRVAHK
jgi:hypothetical protein